MLHMPSLEPQVSACWNFNAGQGEKRATICIVPVRLGEVNGQYHVSWACSRGCSCRTATCLYARGEDEQEQAPDAMGAGRLPLLRR